MKISRITTKLVILAMGALFASGAMADANNGTWVAKPITFLNADKTLGSIVADNVTYTFTTIGDISTAYYNANFSQQLGTVESKILSSGAFGLTSTSNIAVVGNQVALSGVDNFTVSQSPSFNLLAAHVGGGELLFGWAPLNTADFVIRSSIANFSDYYRFNADGLVIQSSIPEPQTYVMMLLGLLAVGYMVRRRNSDSESGDGSFAM